MRHHLAKVDETGSSPVIRSPLRALEALSAMHRFRKPESAVRFRVRAPRRRGRSVRHRHGRTDEPGSTPGGGSASPSTPGGGSASPCKLNWPSTRSVPGRSRFESAAGLLFASLAERSGVSLPSCSTSVRLRHDAPLTCARRVGWRDAASTSRRDRARYPGRAPLVGERTGVHGGPASHWRRVQLPGSPPARLRTAGFFGRGSGS